MNAAEPRALLALTTAPDEAVARELAHALLEERLVACVNILPGMQAMYWWRGKIEAAGECVLLLKTSTQRWAALKARLPQLHPYEVPELVALEIADGLEPYLGWVVSEARGSDQ